LSTFSVLHNYFDAQNYLYLAKFLDTFCIRCLFKWSNIWPLLWYDYIYLSYL